MTLEVRNKTDSFMFSFIIMVRKKRQQTMEYLSKIDKTEIV